MYNQQASQKYKGEGEISFCNDKTYIAYIHWRMVHMQHKAV